MKLTDELLRGLGERVRKEFFERYVVQRICVWHTGGEKIGGSTNVRIDFAARGVWPAWTNSAIAHIPFETLSELGELGTEKLFTMVLHLLRQIIEHHCVRTVPQEGVMEVLPLSWQDNLPPVSEQEDE